LTVTAPRRITVPPLNGGDAEMTEAAFAAGGSRTTPGSDLATTVATVGVIAAGVALLEAALVPGVLIGGAIVLAPRLVPRKLGASFREPLSFLRRMTGAPASPPPRQSTALVVAPAPAADRSRPNWSPVTTAVIKTITFRVIVTTLDFTTNFVVLGELGTAAGLSAFSLVVGPVFFFVHETAWTYLGPAIKETSGLLGAAIEVPLPAWIRAIGKEPSATPGAFTISRALAKTITFRAFATTMDFTVNYVVTGDVATAALLSATGFVLGPFVYLGHEMAWDRYGPAIKPPEEKVVRSEPEAAFAG
jgi:uncharacterized membrane protein